MLVVKDCCKFFHEFLLVFLGQESEISDDEQTMQKLVILEILRQGTARDRRERSKVCQIECYGNKYLLSCTLRPLGGSIWPSCCTWRAVTLLSERNKIFEVLKAQLFIQQIQ